MNFLQVSGLSDFYLGTFIFQNLILFALSFDSSGVTSKIWIS